MRRNLKARLRTLAIIAGAFAFCAPAWSDAGIPGRSSGTQRMCYCDCDAKAGAAMCTHMCELAKYENRSWASSCHKKPASDAAEPAVAPGARSAKNNRIQQARR
jgi:hypothetical protein